MPKGKLTIIEHDEEPKTKKIKKEQKEAGGKHSLSVAQNYDGSEDGLARVVN